MSYIEEEINCERCGNKWIAIMEEADRDREIEDYGYPIKVSECSGCTEVKGVPV